MCVAVLGFVFQSFAQSGPVFTEHPDITVSCEEAVPPMADCEATASEDCPGPVTITTFDSETGAIEQHCTLSPSKLGNSVGWAFWLSLENMPVERWKFDGPAYLEKYADGTARLWGTIVNYENASYKFNVDLWFGLRRNWEEWSALGRGYRNESGLAGDNYLDWDYYELIGEFSSFVGTAGLEGNYLNVMPYPTSKFYGFQSGIAANNKNANPGFGGAFCYTGMVLGEHCGAGVGHISVDTSCDDGNEGCASTTYTRICRAVDTCGNVNYHTQQIHVVDNTPPVLDEYEAVIDVECGEHYQNFISATDNCSEVVITYTDQLIIPGCGGQILRTYKVSDGCGNFVTATQTINLLGDASPEFVTFPEDTTISCSNTGELSNVLIEWTGPCQSVVLSYSDFIEPGDCPGNYTLIRTYTLSDDCGNEVSRDWHVQVEDTTPPVLEGVPANVSLNCGDEIPEVEVTAKDDCDLAPVNVTLVATTEYNECGYNFIRTWTAMDGCGNVAEAVQVITLTDQNPPVFTFVPEDINLVCSDENVLDEVVMAEASDDCWGVIVLYEDSPLPGNCGDGVIRTFTATDACGNSVSAVQTITFTDDEAPVFTFVPSDITVNCGEEYELQDAVAEDNCSAVTVSFEDDYSGSCAGGFTRTYTATDGCGNTASASVNVTIIDNEAPIILSAPEDVVVDCNSIPAIETANLEYMDNCGAVDVSFTENTVETSNACAGSYTIVREWVVSDDCGNSTVVVWNIHVQDNEAPVLQGVPADASLNCGDEIPEAEVTAQDNCDGGVTVTLVASTEFNECGYDFIRTWTAVDQCGNVAQAVQVISMADQEPPVFTFIPEDVNLACSDGTTVDDLEIATASDDCLGVVVLFEDSSLGGNCGDGILRTFTATDACGNSITATQTITFTDDEAPVFTFVPSDITVNCGEEYELQDVIAEDNCSTVTVSYEDDYSGSCAGGFTRTYTATDGCGNTATASVNVVIVDNEAPIILSAPEDVVVDCNSIPAIEEANIEYMDNCGAVDVSFTENTIETPGTCTGSYTIVREWVVSDDCGNSTVVVWNVHVQDNEAPVLQGVPADAFLNCGDEIPEAEVTAQDNCDGGVTVTLVATTEFNECGYDFIRTWTAVDQCGNVAQAVQVISMADQEPPVFTFIPEDVNLACSDGTTLDDLEIATASDDCLGVVVLFEDTFLGGNCGDGILRTFTATDACGNSITATQTITFTDDEAPVFTFVPEDIIAECGSGVVLEDAVATDNCSTVTITYEDEANGPCGSFIRTYTATDGCGNSTQATVTVSIADDQAPVITGVPEDFALNCSDEMPEFEVSATDNCTSPENIVLTVETEVEVIECGYVYTTTWTATDECGNSSQATHVATIADTEAPVFVYVPENITVECGNEYELEDAVAEDDCSDLQMSVEIEELDDCAGSFKRVFTAIDACGNTAVAEQIVTLVDLISPVLLSIPEDLVLSCGSEIPSIDTDELTYEDECSSAYLAFSTEEIIEGDCSGNYTIVRNYEVQDQCYNRVTFNWTITVVDDTAPVFDFAPATLVLDCSAEVPVFDVQASDACSDEISYTYSEEYDDTECGYQITRTRTATDGCGNTSEISQLVVVEDFAPPVFSFLPENMTLSCSDLIPDAVFPDAEDACSGSTEVTMTETILQGTCPSNYTIYRVYRSSDDCGNEAIYNQTITVADTEGPEFFNFESEIITDCEQSNTVFVIVLDNCGTASLEYTDEAFGSGCDGGLYRTYIATDECGNQTTAQQTIILTDDTPPVFLNFPTDVEVSCDNVPEVSAANIQYQDNCSDVEVLFTESLIEGDCPDNYTLERAWTLLDACGNTTAATWTITVKDTEAPVLVGIPMDVFIDCSEEVPAAEVYAVDNCSSDVPVSLFATTVQEGCNEIFIRRWYAEDACGNLSQAIQNVVIIDLYPPVLSEYPEDMTLICGAAVPEAPFITATDNCAGEIDVIFNETVEGTPNCPVITREWCATDCTGNEECHVQTITYNTTGGMIADGMTAWSVNSSNAVVEIRSEEESRWRLDVLDITGRVVAQLFDGTMNAGEVRSLNFNPLTYGDSVYIIRYTNGKKNFAQKLFFFE